jgi:deoxyribodipyrimidine photo-lyase
LLSSINSKLNRFMAEKTILVWFRNDLRVHDNEILLEAIRKADKVLPVFVFDSYYFTKKADGSPKTGILRAQFLLESVACLRENLRKIGGELIIKIGNPAIILPQLAEAYGVNEVYHHREVAHEETSISEQVEASLWKIKLNLKHFIGHTLYHKEDLPFPIKDIPDSFAVFKKKVERDSVVRPCLATPTSINITEIADAGSLPTLRDLGFEYSPGEIVASDFFSGGETVALERLQDFLSVYNTNSGVKGVRGAVALNNSSKLSPWIALGCISLRHVYWEVTSYLESNNITGTHQIILDLLWRDYFRFMFKKHGEKFIATKNSSGETSDLAIDEDLLFEEWKNGNTGVSLIDDIMSELNTTGYINNYSRQLVAGYLVNDLKVDWKKGAIYFEEKLIDYSPASNWGNWAFIAGVNNALESKYQIAAKPASLLKQNLAL